MTPSSRFNLSRWALEHPALTRYLLLVLLLMGFAAYFQLKHIITFVATKPDKRSALV